MAKGNSKDGNGIMSLFSSPPHFEINGNKEVIVEGSKGVLEYDTKIIRINTNSMVVCFRGRGLNVKCISPSALIIQGFITNIEFTV